MRIGITGITGLIGTALAKTAIARGHEVVAFSRRKNLSSPWAKEVRQFDPASSEILDPCGLDALVHLAGESIIGFWTAKKKARIRDSRVETTRRIVDALKKCPQRPQTFICASAVGAYGNQGDELLTETSSHGMGFLAEVCDEWEVAALGAEALDMRVVLLRTGMVLARDGGTWPLLQRIFSWNLGGRLGSGKQWVPWVHLDDEVGIILHAIEQTAYRGAVNIAAPNPVTNAHLTRAIAAQLHRITMPPVPTFLLRLILGDLSSVMLDSQRAIPKVAMEQGYTFVYPLLEQALKALV